MIMSLALLRGIAWMKRLALAAERQADSLETLARIESDKWARQYAPRPKGGFVSGVMDVKAANERYRKMQEAEKYGTDPSG